MPNLATPCRGGASHAEPVISNGNSAPINLTNILADLPKADVGTSDIVAGVQKVTGGKPHLASKLNDNANLSFKISQDSEPVISGQSKDNSLRDIVASFSIGKSDAGRSTSDVTHKSNVEARSRLLFSSKGKDSSTGDFVGGVQPNDEDAKNVQHPQDLKSESRHTETTPLNSVVKLLFSLAIYNPLLTTTTGALEAKRTTF